MSGYTKGSAHIVLVGDVLVHRADPHNAFNQIRGLLTAHVLFGNFEGDHSAVSAVPPHVGAAIVADPSNVAGLASAGFTVMSCTNSHIGDGGHGAMLETAEHLRSAAKTPVGIGANLADARAPAIVEAHGGVRIAILALASVFRYEI